MDNRFLVVGAPSTSRVQGGFPYGAVYIYEDKNGNYNYGQNPVQVIEKGGFNSWFGKNIKMHNDVMVISAPFADSLYVYFRDYNNPSKPWALKQAFPVSGSDYGFSLNGNHLVIGSKGYNASTKGTFYVYEKSANGFVYVYSRTNNGLPSWATQSYGTSVDIFNNYLIVSDPGANKAEILSGGGGGWSLVSTISGQFQNGAFGQKVAIKHNYVVVNEHFTDGGKTYLFENKNGQFTFNRFLNHDHQYITTYKAGDIALSDDGYVVVTNPLSSMPGIAEKSDRGIAYFGKLYDLAKSRTDSYEYNDNRYNAKTINLLEYRNSAIGNSGDNDYFKLTISSPNELLFYLQNGNQNLSLQLYNESGTLIATAATSGSEERILQSLTAGTYYVRVYAAGSIGGAENYKLLVLPIQCYSISPVQNNTAGTAADLTQTLNVRLNGSLPNPGEQDWYTFTTTGSSTVEFKLTTLYSDFNMYLLNSSLGTIASSTNSGTSNETIVKQNLPAGKYYLKIAGATSSNYSTRCFNLEANLFTGGNARTDIMDNETVMESEISGLVVYPSVIGKGGSVNLSCKRAGNITQPIQVIELSTGRIVSETEFKGSEINLDMSDLQTGLYIINAGEIGRTKVMIK